MATDAQQLIDAANAAQAVPSQGGSADAVMKAAAAGAVVQGGQVAATAPRIVAAPAVAAAAVPVGTAWLGFKWHVLLTAMQAFFRRRHAETARWLAETLPEREPGVPVAVIQAIIDRELSRERLFQQKALKRLEPEAAAIAKLPTEAAQAQRIREVVARERHYVSLREQAIANRAFGALASWSVRQESPQGAKWQLGPRKNHTPRCVWLAGKNWSWDALDAVGLPPQHAGCGCFVSPLGPGDSLPDPGESMRMARQALTLEEGLRAVADPGEVDDWLTGEPVRPSIARALERIGGTLVEASALPTGVMVALYPTPSVAQKLAVKGGEPVDEIHCTLAFLGKADALPDPEALRKAVADWAARTPPIEGEISGHGLFTAGPEPVTYATPDLPALPEARADLMDALDGHPVSKDHGFTPHMTIAYADKTASLPDHGGRKLSFSKASLVIGGERHDFKLAGNLQEANYVAGEHLRDRLGKWIDMPGVHYNPTLGNEARNSRATKGYIEIGPKFADLPPRQQTHAIAHEYGHDLADELLHDVDGWWWNENAWKDAEGIPLGGPGYLPAERISDAYAALATDSKEDVRRWPAIARIGEEAARRGYPLDFPGHPVQEASYKEALHPRGRGGRWVRILEQVKAAKMDDITDVEGHSVMRLKNEGYSVRVGVHGRVTDANPEVIADAIEKHLDDRAKLGQEMTLANMDENYQRWFHPQQLEGGTATHPRSGYNVHVGKWLAVQHPPSNADGPPIFKVSDYGNGDKMFPDVAAGTEPIRELYRGVSLDEWRQAVERGYLQSDQRGTIAGWEGTNAGVDPQTAQSYLPRGAESVIVKMDVRPEDGWFTRNEDGYLRTRERIPLDRVTAVSPVLYKDKDEGLFVRPDETVPMPEHLGQQAPALPEHGIADSLKLPKSGKVKQTSSGWGDLEGLPSLPEPATAPAEGYRHAADVAIPGADAPSVDNLPAAAYDDPSRYMDKFNPVIGTSTHGTTSYDESLATIRVARGNPDSEITVYRGGVPAGGGINSGDWVALSRRYAELIQGIRGGEIYTARVPARMVHWGGRDLNEFAYHGPTPKAVQEARWTEDLHPRGRAGRWIRKLDHKHEPSAILGGDEPGRAAGAGIASAGARGSDLRRAGGPDVLRLSPVDVSTQAGYDRYVAGIRGNSRPEFITVPSREELASKRAWMSDDGAVGVTVSPDGEIGNLFRNDPAPGGDGLGAVRFAAENGGKWLDCYDGKLAALYRSVGFSEVARVKFDPGFAPDGWDYELRDHPDVVFMGHGVAEKKGAYVDSWDAAVEATQRAVAATSKHPGWDERTQRVGVEVRDMIGKMEPRADWPSVERIQEVGAVLAKELNQRQGAADRHRTALIKRVKALEASSDQAWDQMGQYFIKVGEHLSPERRAERDRLSALMDANFKKLTDLHTQIFDYEVRRQTEWRESIRQLLSTVRPMGGKLRHGDEPDDLSAARDNAPNIRAAIDNVQTFLPSDWLNAMNKDGSARFLVREGRGLHRPVHNGEQLDSEITVPPLDNGGIALHEILHRLQATDEPDMSGSGLAPPLGKVTASQQIQVERVGRQGGSYEGMYDGRYPVVRRPGTEEGRPGPYAAIYDWVAYDGTMKNLQYEPSAPDGGYDASRWEREAPLPPTDNRMESAMNRHSVQAGHLIDRQGETPEVALVDLLPQSGYRSDEVTVPDGWPDPYYGKMYGGSYGNAANELLTMAAQDLFYHPSRLKKDPGTYHWILGFMAAL